MTAGDPCSSAPPTIPEEEVVSGAGRSIPTKPTAETRIMRCRLNKTWVSLLLLVVRVGDSEKEEGQRVVSSPAPYLV